MNTTNSHDSLGTGEGKKRPQLEFYTVATDATTSVQMLEDAQVHAGFPSPVDDAYMSQPIDLNRELVPRPATTYIMKVIGDSMIEEGIDEGDLLVVDRSLFPTERNIAVCMLDGEFALKRIVQRDGRLLLMSGNQNYPPIEVADPTLLRVWGVVLWIMKKMA